jgi:hypothetical protein
MSSRLREIFDEPWNVETAGHRQVNRSFFESGCLHHFSGFEAASTDPDSQRPAGHEGLYGLKVGIEPAAGAIVRVAHSVAELGAFSANVATLRHWINLRRNIPYESKRKV